MTELEAMQAIASAARGWWQPGQLAWDDANAHWGEPCAVLVGDGWWGRVTGSLLQGLVRDDASARTVVEWGTAQGATAAEVADERLVAALLDAGFAHDDGAPFALDLRRPASEDLAAARHVRPGTPDEVVRTHRAAWKPSTLPFVVPLSSDAESGYDADVHARVMASPLFREELCVVAVDGRDEPTGSCIAWLDDTTGIANIEPLGVVPEHRRDGVAGALLHHVVRAVACLGGTEVLIQPRGDAAYPAPRGAYRKAGFTQVGRTWALARHTVGS